MKDRIVDLTVPHNSFGPERLREEIDKEAASVSSVLGVNVSRSECLLSDYLKSFCAEQSSCDPSLTLSLEPGKAHRPVY